MKYFELEDTGLIFNDKMTVVEPTEEIVEMFFNEVIRNPRVETNRNGFYTVLAWERNNLHNYTGYHNTREEAEQAFQNYKNKTIQNWLNSYRTAFEKFRKNFE